MRVSRPDAATWSARLADPRLTDLPFTQRPAWAAHKAHAGWFAHYLIVEAAEDWAGIALLTRRLPGGLGRFAYAARGPVVVAATSSAEGALRAAIVNELSSLRADGVTLVRFEPGESLPLPDDADPVHPPAALRAVLQRPYLGAAVPCGALQPRSSAIIDLRGGIAAVRAGYKSSQRSTLRTAERHGVSVREGALGDLPAFAAVMAATAARAGFTGRDAATYASLLESHGGDATLLVAEAPELGVIGGLLLVHTRTTSTYLYAGTTDAGSALRATYALLDAAIVHAIERGSARLDLWGLPTPGIAAFKAGWGGQAVAYAGGMEQVIDPLRGRLAAVALRLRGGGRA